ncbi:MAG: squalene--hopene cyclase [Pseudomonadota bacterium]
MGHVDLKSRLNLISPAAAEQARRLSAAIERARDALLARQHPEGYWCFELEADCTIPAEYICMMHFLGEVDEALQARLAAYLRSRQQEDGGWPLYPGGGLDLSCTVKAYYALKLAGDAPGEGHMRRARKAIIARGGAARSNVFTRYLLAMFGQVPWRAVPFLPVEIMLLPRWFPFHLSKVSYWSRTVMVPLAILYSLRARARNPKGIHVRELFTVDPEKERDYFPVRSRLNGLFLRLERTVRLLEPLIPGRVRRAAIARAERWIVERLNGEGGLGAIFPAMVNTLEAFRVLGYPREHPLCRTARRAIDKLLVVRDESAYCQPCVSPVWDTALAVLALLEEGSEPGRRAARKALDWLEARQLLDAPGDWRESRPDLPGGGWPFQFRNDHYPDLDDTAVVAWAMRRADAARYGVAIERAARWICGMQSRNGGFAAFDADNTHDYLLEIPFADHGALLDPPTADVSARCATLLALLKKDPEHARALERCTAYLLGEQESDGSWFGRWGTNYIYGTWSAAMALEHSGDPRAREALQRGAAWLKRVQRPDGGWGETNDSYADPSLAGRASRSTAFQTAWAVLGLLAAGETGAPELWRGVEYLLRTQESDGRWDDPEFTAPGFPRVFYLKYHGYSVYFPLWALARAKSVLAPWG